MKHHMILAASLALSGCMAPANPPSLLPRAIETKGESAIAKPAPIVKPLEPALADRLSALVREAMAGDADFVSADTAAGRALAAGKGAAPGSERWIVAEQARSALESAHQRSTASLAEIDTLAIARADLIAGDATIGGLADYQAAQAEVEIIVARQSARLDALNR